MKKVLVCMLSLLLLIMLVLPAAFAVGNAPRPTPPPAKVAEGGVPVHTLALEGMDATKWKEAFLSYAEEQDIPVEEGGFVCVTEGSRKEFYEIDKQFTDEPDVRRSDSVYRMHRVMAGGAEVFVQEVDDTTIVQFVVLLDYDLLMTDVLADALRYYFPLVVRACIYASEPDASEEVVELVQKELCPDISWLIHNKFEVETRAVGDAARYYFGTCDFSFTDEYYIIASGIWEEVDVESDDTVQAQTSVTETGDFLDGIVEEPIEEEITDASGQWLYILKDGGATITGNVGLLTGELSIPGELDGLRVTAIGDYAFESSTLERITLPDTVISIGDSAFLRCFSLTEITLPGSLISIGDSAFADSSLSQITLPSSLISIGGGAFSMCDLLTEITLPESLISIGWNAWDICRNLTRIEVLPGNPVYASLDGVLFDQSSGILHTYPCGKESDVYTVPDGVTAIGECAFNDCQTLTQVILPDSLTSIDEYAFLYCGSLTEIILPDSLTSIGEDAFYGCDELILSVHRGSYAEQYAKENEIPYVFVGSEASIVVEDDEEARTDASGQWIYMLKYGGAMILGCVEEQIGALTIPDTLDGYKVTGIEEEALWGDDLTSVTIPDSVTNISPWAFIACVGLTDFDVSSDNPVYMQIDGVLFDKTRETLITYPAAREGAFTIPEGVLHVGELAFANCYGLTNVIIQDSVMSISHWAFYWCDALTGFDVSSNNPAYKQVDGVLFDKTLVTLILYPTAREGAYTIPEGVVCISETAFTGCAGLTYVIIPDSVTSIGRGAFASLENLTGVTIGTGVTHISDGAFDNCGSLAAVTIPDSVTSIGNGAFGICSSLTSVTIPESVTSIGDYAFRGCRSLTSVTLPYSVKVIGERAFIGCDGLAFAITPDSYAEQYAKENGIPYKYVVE